MVRLVDDVDKESDADRTVAFAFAGKEYDIDLCTANAEQFEAEMTFWIQNARKRGTAPKHVTRAQAQRAKEPEPEPPDDEEWWHTPEGASKAEVAKYNKMRQEIREWGIRNGWPSLGERGRLPRALYAKWRDHHQALPSRGSAKDSDDPEPEQTSLNVAPQFSDDDTKKAHRTRKAAS